MDEDMWRAKWLSKDRRIIIKGPWDYELKIKKFILFINNLYNALLLRQR